MPRNPKAVRTTARRACRAGRQSKGPGSVAAGMKWLQSLNAIIIDPVRCPETAAEFTGYEYLRDARTGEVTNAWPDADNHHIDAVRYALESVWRRQRQLNPQIGKKEWIEKLLGTGIRAGGM